MMARGLALNPASLPFFPGSGMQQSNTQKDERVADREAFPGAFPSPRSSPSPPQAAGRQQHETQAVYRTINADRAYPRVEAREERETSMIGHIDSTETVQPYQANGFPNPDTNITPTPAVVVSTMDTTLASSPASSASAPSLAGPQPEQSFDTQAKTSPFIHDILDRLIRCEYTTRELQRELSDVNRKLTFLVERAMATDSNRNTNNGSPTVGAAQSQLSISPPSAGGSMPRPPSSNSDSLMAQRMDTLTASVSQLLAIHAQQQIQNVNSPFAAGQSLGVNHLNNVNMALGIAPDQIAPNMQGMAQLGLGHPLPNRPDLGGLRSAAVRTPAPPGRTWSQGSLDLPPRPDSLGRPDNLLNQKRRSVIGLSRRDSASTIDGDWGSNTPREGGPVITKWEHLPLVPDLLRSIAKYGVGPPNKIQQRALPFLLRGADIIAQAPPTQERIAAYVIPAIHVALTWLVGKSANRGPVVVIISTTVDQATQAQRMIRDLGGAIGVRSALGVGTGGDVVQEIRLLQQSMPHILCGTPQKLHALFTTPGGLTGSEVRFLVLDEVDQLIARNLHDFVFNIVKLFPPPRSRALGTPNASPAPIGSQFNPFDSNSVSSVPSPFQSNNISNGQRPRFPSIAPSPNLNDPISSSPNLNGSSSLIERQTALFSNTVPQDVLNLANAIQLREPVRVLVRRDGNVAHADSNSGTRGLRQFYLYLAFTAGGRIDHTASGTAPGGGLGIIGSGRSATTNAETAQAREWKLDALADLFDDIDVGQAIVHVGGLTALDNVVFKLASRGLEAVPLHGDMNAASKLAALNKFRASSSVIMRQPVTKVLVVYDVQVKAPDVFQVPLVINYDLPKAVEEYAHRVAPAISSSYNRAGVVINFVTATGGDVEMLRSIECFYKIKCPEVPMSLRDVI